MANSGKIGVSTKDLFPIIKKFLYSDHDIFLREIVSNAIDATQKMKMLASSGEFKGELGDLKIRIKADKEAGTLTVSDRGIGMTEEEVEKYINQIAFSGAEEFLEKHKDDAATIIGHFGLGFYSAFMVSDSVDIITKSYKRGSKAVKWNCKGDTDYTIEPIEKKGRGTDIVMHINEEEREFLEDDKIRELLNKYCKFLPIEIVFGKKQEWKDGKYVDTEEDNVINDTKPAWTRKPSELKEEDYLTFYHDLYPMAEDPLFHIHLNVDYPFTLTGILYFPKIDNRFEIQKNKIQLYCNQVFVTDSVEGIVPDYLTLLHGVIDSPDIPLNVSRSYLQSDRNVKQISGHITKKVADSLADIFKNNREEYEKKWNDLKIFIEYGMLTDDKFRERAMSIALLENTEKKYFTFEEYQELVGKEQTDKDGNTVYLYATNIEEQYSYIEAAKSRGYDVLFMDGQLESHFISLLEQHLEKRKFARVDADVLDKLIRKEDAKSVALSENEQSELRSIFNSQLPTGDVTYSVSFESMGEGAEPAIITRSEWMRRMKDMSALNPGMAYFGAMGEQYNLVINSDHPLTKRLLEEEKSGTAKELEPIYSEIAEIKGKITEIDELNKGVKAEDIPQSDKDKKSDLEKQIKSLEDKKSELLTAYGKDSKLVGELIDLALLANGLLKGEALSRFVKRSVEMI